ncbi:MAG: phage capsid protein [Tildeniella torsiva UHER 1998/13D]|jgi:hypothetical protein|nr:phage capsid protein [Tildeniella torsiva UHER 1998/13D]
MTANYPFPINNEYTAVAIAYRNTAMIADEVLPITPVSKKFTWIKHTKEEGYTAPDDKVGRKSRPNQISFTGTEQTDSTEDYAYDDPIPQDDIDANNIPGYDVVGKSTMYLSNLLELRREKRVADLVFDAAQYPTDNKVTLSGSGQYSHPDSNPLNDLLTRLDVPLMRPNAIAMGQDVWRVLRQHPTILAAIKGTGAGRSATAGEAGVIAREQLAELLEIEAVLVGQGWINTAARGQTPTFVRVWGKSISMMYRDVLAGPQRGTTFGFTGQFGTRIAGTIPDPHIGMRGGQITRVGWSQKEIISAADLGYLISAAVA